MKKLIALTALLLTTSCAQNGNFCDLYDYPHDFANPEALTDEEARREVSQNRLYERLCN